MDKSVTRTFRKLCAIIYPQEFCKRLLIKVGSILEFSFDIDTDTGQKTSDSISIFLISVE